MFTIIYYNNDVKSGAEYGGQVCGLGFAETRSGRVTRTVVTSGREGPVFGSRVNTWGFEDDRRSREFRLNGDGVAAGRGAEGNLRPWVPESPPGDSRRRARCSIGRAKSKPRAVGRDSSRKRSSAQRPKEHQGGPGVRAYRRTVVLSQNRSNGRTRFVFQSLRVGRSLTVS